MIERLRIASVLADSDPAALESLALRAREETRRHFGRAVSLYAPLYLANYCENECLYCGFRRSRKQMRRRMERDESRREMETLAKTGIQSILLLTGESRRYSPLDYILEHVALAREFFPSISLEVYPLDEYEYHQAFEAGVDGVTLYQETYCRPRYAELHPAGRKADFEFRHGAPERMARAGLRFINLGVLLGLSDPSEDVAALFNHLRDLERRYPGVEWGLSFPRLLPVDPDFPVVPVSDRQLVQLLCLARLLFPRVSLTLSTRERASFRDRVLEIAVNRVSAGSHTGVGGYSSSGLEVGMTSAGALPPGHDRDPQFEVQDTRTVSEMVTALKKGGFDPVFTDWRRIPVSVPRV